MGSSFAKKFAHQYTYEVAGVPIEYKHNKFSGMYQLRVAGNIEFATDKFFDNGNRISFQVDDNAGGEPHDCKITTISTWSFGFKHIFEVDGEDISTRVKIDKLDVTERTSKMGSVAFPAAKGETAIASV